MVSSGRLRRQPIIGGRERLLRVGWACASTLLIVLGAERLIVLVPAVATIWFLRRRLSGVPSRGLRVAFVLLAFATLGPVDVSLKTRPGRPGFVPYVKGLPTQEAIESARRGEVVLGGCVVYGSPLLVPRWMFVW